MEEWDTTLLMHGKNLEITEAILAEGLYYYNTLLWGGMKMITCGECGRVNGKGQIGKSWICEDCKVGGEEKAVLIDGIQQEKPTKTINECEEAQGQRSRGTC